jgi:hypothetical protein
MTEDVDLFGNPVQPAVEPAVKQRPKTNDVGLVEQVLRVACNEGYALLGPQERVYRVGPKDAHGASEVSGVSPAEADAVHQLIDNKDLSVGGQHQYRYRNAREGYGRSVLVPNKTRGMSARWTHLSRPTNWPQSGQQERTGT